MRRASLTAFRSSSARNTPGSTPPSARMSPQGEMIREQPKVSRPSVCFPSLRRSDHITPGFNGSGLQQRVPVCLPSHLGECRGNRNDIGASLGEHAIKIRKPQVITDRHADAAERCGRQNSMIARPIGAGLAIGLAVADIHVEHVNLVIAGDDLASRIDEK